MLIPGAFELNAPPHRASAAVRPLVDVEIVGARAANPVTPYVVAASSNPTTPLAHAAAFLKDAVLIAGIIYGVALVPGLAIRGVEAAAALILKAIGRQ